MDIFETETEMVRGTLAGLAVGSVCAIEVRREKVGQLRSVVWKVKGEFGIGIKTRYVDGKLHLKRVD